MKRTCITLADIVHGLGAELYFPSNLCQNRGTLVSFPQIGRTPRFRGFLFT